MHDGWGILTELQKTSDAGELFFVAVLFVVYRESTRSADDIYHPVTDASN